MANATISLLLVGNKSDLTKREIASEIPKKFAAENRMEYIETSAKTGINISSAFDKIAKEITKKINNGMIDVTQESSGVKLGTEVIGGSKITKLNNTHDNRTTCISC